MRSKLLVILGFLMFGAMISIPDHPPWRIRAGRARVLEDAVHQLGSPKFEERRRARNLLVSMGEDARAELESALNSRDAEVRFQAAGALGAMVRRNLGAADHLIRQYRAVVRAALDLPGELEPGSESRQALAIEPGAAARATSEVASRLRDHPELQVRAIALLREIGRRDGGAGLARILRRGDCLPSILRESAESLIAFGGSDALPDVRIAAGGPDRVARREALRVLAFLGGDSDAGIAREALGDEDPVVRAQAVRTLAILSGRRARADLAAALGDADSTVRLRAVEALGVLGDPGGAAAVRRLLGDPSSEVRAGAVVALARLTSPVEAVEAGIRDASPAVRRAALAASRFLPLGVRRQALLGKGAEPDPGLHELRRKLLALGHAD